MIAFPVESSTDIRAKDSFPSSVAFDAIASALSSDADRKDAVKKGGAIFAFTLKNEKGAQESWHIDLKETGKVGKGTAPEGKKANGEIASSQNQSRIVNERG